MVPGAELRHIGASIHRSNGVQKRPESGLRLLNQHGVRPGYDNGLTGMDRNEPGGLGAARRKYAQNSQVSPDHG